MLLIERSSKVRYFLKSFWDIKDEITSTVLFSFVDWLKIIKGCTVGLVENRPLTLALDPNLNGTEYDFKFFSTTLFFIVTLPFCPTLSLFFALNIPFNAAESDKSEVSWKNLSWWSSWRHTLVSSDIWMCCGIWYGWLGCMGLIAFLRHKAYEADLTTNGLQFSFYHQFLGIKVSRKWSDYFL